MGGRTMIWGSLTLLLLSGISSSQARSAASQQDAASARHLLSSADDLVSAAQVPAACSPPANSSTLTKTGCSAGCQSCKKQVSASGSRDCVCCKAGYVPSTNSIATCTACPVGSTAARAGSTRCTNCTRGLTTSSRAAITCNACPAGRELTPGATPPACRLCAAGSVSAGALLTAKPACSACSGNKTTVGANRIRCNGCKPGFGGPLCGMCKSGFWSRGGAATNATVCRACPDGTFTLGEGATAQAACLNTTIAVNTTIPINVTTLSTFELANATCSKALEDALVAKYNEEKQKAAAADGFLLSFTTKVVNCTEVPGSGSGRKLSAVIFTSAQIFTISATISATYRPLGGSSGSSTLYVPGYFGCPSGLCGFAISGGGVAFSGLNDPGASSLLWGSVGQSFDNAALQGLESIGSLSAGGASFNFASADLSQFTLVSSSGGATVFFDAQGNTCTEPPTPDVFKLPAGFDILKAAWQLNCGITKPGQSCSAAACENGAGTLTATCSAGGAWTNGTGSCTPLTCEKAAAPAFPTSGATFDAAAWGAACGSTQLGKECVTGAACSSGQQLSATCEYLPVGSGRVATWTKLTGSCTAAAGPVQCMSAPENVPTTGGAVFFSELWIGQCGMTKENATCTVVDAVCSSGGTISAKCSKGANGAGVWTDIQGSCKAAVAPPVQCSSAPQNVPTLGGSVFSTALWIGQCNTTTENSTCTVVDAACSSGGTISAKCSKGASGAGVWTDIQGSCKAPAALPVQCMSAPDNVPTLGGSVFFSEPWIGQCGMTKENSTCTVVDAACSSGGTISAKCSKGANGAGVWTDIQGSCKAPAPVSCGTTPMPSAAAGWITNGAPLSATAWAAACSQTVQGQTCSAAACGGGFTGTLSAVCQANGQWGQLSGTCTGTCSGAPGFVPTSGGGAFSATAWQAACSSTTRGNSCTANNACSAGTGVITAQCDASGSWINVQGACSLVPCASTTGMQAVPNLDPVQWVSFCGTTAVGQQCVSSGVCKDNTFGFTSATCTATGWINASGNCAPPPGG